MLSKIVLFVLAASFGIFILLATTFSSKWIILISSVVPIFFASIIIQDKKKFLLALMITDMSLCIDKHFFQEPNLIVPLDGLQISITTIVLGALYLQLWIEIIMKRANELEFFPKITVVALGYILSCLLSTYNSQNILMSVTEIFFNIQMVLVFFYIVNYIKSMDDIVYIMNVFLACLFIQSAVIFIEFGGKIDLSFTKGISSGFAFTYFHEGKTIDVFRPNGTSGDANAAGGQIAMLLLVILTLVLYTKDRFKKILVGIMFLMGLGALILTFSRGSWVSFTVGLVVFLLLALRYRWVSGKKIVLGAVLCTIVISVFSVPITARLSQDDRGSSHSRIPLMKLASNMIQEHPLIGVGTNNFGIVLPDYLSSELRGEWLHIVHNHYLLVLAEIGSIGLFFWLLIMIIVIHTCFRNINYNVLFLSPLLAGILAAVIALSLFMMVELSGTRLIQQPFWIMVSIAMASEKLITINRQQSMDLPMPLKVKTLTGKCRA